MNLERIITPPVLAIIAVAGLTTFFGRKNTALVINQLGSAFSSSISAALGKGADIK